MLWRATIAPHLAHGIGGANGGLGAAAETQYVVSDADLEPRDWFATVETEAGRRHVWQFPADPRLPALTAAIAGITQDEVIRAAIGKYQRYGILAYRPLRRAVVQVEGTHGRVFAKVLLPRKLEGALRRHRLMEAAGVLVPRVLQWREDGLLVLSDIELPSLADVLFDASPETEETVATVPGEIAADGVLNSAEYLAQWRGTSLDPDEIVALLDAFPQAVLDLPPRPALADRAQDLAAGITLELAAQWRDIAERVRRYSDAADLGPVVPTHGDLSASNLRPPWGPHGEWGLIDLDTIGPGHRIDDLACLLANVAALPAFDPARLRAGAEYSRVLIERFSRHVDPALLRVRAAGVLVTLASAEEDPATHRAWLAVAREFLDDPAV